MFNFKQRAQANSFCCKIIKTKLLVLILCVAGIEVQAQHRNNYVENQIIIKLKPNVKASNIASMKESLKASVFKKFNIIGAELWNISGVTVEEAIRQYQGDPRFEYIEPNYEFHVFHMSDTKKTIPNDPDFSQLWGLHNIEQTGGWPDGDIDAPEAWSIQTGGNVVIGIIDTGVDWTHEDLADNIWVNPGEIPDNRIDDDGNGFIDDIRGWDFINGDNDPKDDNGHGTHVAGTIAAVGNNGIGVTGVCWSAQIMPLKFLGSGGSGVASDAILALEYAAKMGAKLTNNSWGGVEDSVSIALREAIAASGEAGMLFIAAAGNDASNNDISPVFPASYDLDNIIAVAATDHNDLLSIFSNVGKTSVDLAAPGSLIYSTLRLNRYGLLSGTSMAAPHVSGAAALIWSHNSNLTNSQVKNRILASVDPYPHLQETTVSGGRLNVFMALAEQDTIPPNVVTDLTTTNPTSNSITLTWTASGDDGAAGTASDYDIRYAVFQINAVNFDSATEVSGEPTPQEAGSQETFTVIGLDVNTTYYFTLKVFDEWGNGSPVPNSTSATTLGAPDIAVSPNFLSESLATGENVSQTLTISNVGVGSLNFDISIENGGAATASTRTNPPGFARKNAGDLNGSVADIKFAIDRKLSLQENSNISRGKERDSAWIFNILRANEEVAAGPPLPIAETEDPLVFTTTPQVRADEIWQKRQQGLSFAKPTYAVVLDGIGTLSANVLMWDELNANWSLYGDKEILIDYSTFHNVEITYDGLVASGVDLVIISDNWDPTDSYGPFSEAEAMAIARYVDEGAGLYISAGTLNNGEFPDLQHQVNHLAPLVGLSANETYFWNGNTYGDLDFVVPGHPILRNISEPFSSGWQSKTLVPASGTWTPEIITSGTLVGISENGQTALVVNGDRIYHAGLPEHESGTESDKQFIYNVITLAGSRPTWLSVDPFQGTVLSGSSMDIAVTFDATGLDRGDYAANIIITSNDPDDNQFTLPINLNITEEGVINQLELTWCDTQLSDITGSQDTVYVCLNDVTGKNIVSYQLVVTFDENVLDAVGAISAGTISEPFGPPTVNVDVDGQISVGGFGTQPLAGSGQLVGLIFDVVGNPGETTNLCFQSETFNSGNPVANVPDPCCPFDVLDSSNSDISGRVNYGITGAPTGDVSMTLTGGASQAVTTGSDGAYQFKDLQGGLNYTVTLSKSEDFDANSITCFDGALTAQHAVRLITFTPEQQKAADVNEDGFIFTFDAALICRFAVGLPAFSENEQTGQWRFDPRSRSYTALHANQTEQNYVATLLGDTDGNWVPSATLAKEIGTSKRYKYLQDLMVSSGQVVSIPLIVEETNIISADIDFEYDPRVLRFVEVSKTEISDEFKVVNNSENGRLRVGAYSTAGLAAGGTLLFLRFEIVGKEGERSYLNLKRFQLNGKVVKSAEAELVVGSLTPEIPKQFALRQNYPNPFNPETTIRFDIPDLNGRNVQTRLAIYKVTGQLVRILLNEERPPGAYELNWDGKNEAGEIVSSGTYFYSMTAGDFRDTKKMLVLK